MNEEQEFWFPDLKEVGEDFLDNLDSSMVVEKKWDGTAALIQIEDGVVKIWGRGIKKDGRRQDYTHKFPEIRDAFTSSELVNIEILGEIVVMNEDGQESFNAIQPRLNRENDIEDWARKHPATFIIFDIYSRGGRILTNPYFSRSIEADAISILMSSCNRVKSIELMDAPFSPREPILKTIEEEGWEGVVIKDLGAPYGKNQYKYKPRVTQDVFWEGEFVPGKNRNEGKVGSLTCYQYVSGEKICVGNISGLSDDDRQKFTDLQPTVSNTNPRIFEVKTHEVLSSGKFRYPNFIRERTDKSPSQCIQKTRIPTPKKATLNDWL